jgi:uncharacterized membrane protein
VASPRQAQGQAPSTETGRQLGRVNNFSDGLFAIAATLLVLSIDVPRVSHAQLPHQLDNMIQPVLAYFLSFAVVGLFWMRHHQLFGMLRASDTGFAALNLLFLAVVALLPVPTELLGRYGADTAPVVIYAVFILVLSLLLRGLTRHALRAGLTDREPHGRWHVRGQWVLVVFGLSIPVAFLSPQVAMYSWILVAVLPRLHGRSRSVRDTA